MYFFDTPDLQLERAGVVVRARRIQGKGDDSVVKLRPVVPDELPADLRELADFVVEVDAMPGGYVCSASLKGSSPRRSVQRVGEGDEPCASCSPRSSARSTPSTRRTASGSTTSSLLGPIFVLKLKCTPDDFGRKMVVELWLYPDGARILELSTKCAPPEAFQVAAEARAFLAERGIEPASEQQTKTRKALAYFSKSLP